MAMIRVLTGFILAMATLLTAGTPAEAQAYRVKSGDQLRVEVIEDPGLNRDLLVLPDGSITMPLAGSVPARGRTLSEIQRALTTQLTPNFASPPTVFVSIAGLGGSSGPVAPATIDIFILGEAANPGKISVERGTSLIQVFAEMGGFTPFAATKRIQLRRVDNGSEAIYPLNYDAMIEGNSRNGLTTLRDGDVIVVPQRRLFE